MRRFLGKLGFIHHRLWRDGGMYRAALLFGPAPLVGCVVAAALWGALQAVGKSAPPAWATPQAAASWSTAPAHLNTLQPAGVLPPQDADGVPIGYEPGWYVTAHAIQVSRTLNVDVQAGVLSGIAMSGPSADMAQIVADEPASPLYVALGTGLLVARTSGIYALDVRIERQGGPAADCLVRLGAGPRRIVSDLNVDTVGDFSKTFDPAWFRLQPGLYPIGWAFGCWHAAQVSGPGRMTVLVETPGEHALRPARPNEIVRPKHAAR